MPGCKYLARESKGAAGAFNLWIVSFCPRPGEGKNDECTGKREREKDRARGEMERGRDDVSVRIEGFRRRGTRITADSGDEREMEIMEDGQPVKDRLMPNVFPSDFISLLAA